MTSDARIRPFAKFLVTCSLVALPMSASSQPAGSKPANSELEQYLAERRAAAMTEGAESEIRTVANILAGGSTLLVEKGEDGSYGRTYSTALCFRPGAESPEQKRLKAEVEQRTAVELQRLKAAADFDHSGFVTGREGSRLRNIVELGLIIEQLADEDAASVRAVARALSSDENWVTATAAAYEQLRLSLDGTQGAKLPALPRALLPAAPAP